MIRVGDGIKKGTVIAATAILPKSWRVAARKHCLAKLEVAIAQRAKLLIIGHPKSGNTWLKVMLSRLYQMRYGLPPSRLINSDELSLKNPAIPRLAATNGYYSYEGEVGKLLAVDADPTEMRNKPIVFLARHPCDIAVSWYFQFTKRQSTHKQELINHFIEHPINRKTISMWDFVRHSDIGLPFLIDYLNNWENNLCQLQCSLLIKYEDLRAEPVQTLKTITDLMNESFNQEELEEAVNFGSFDNLRQLESKGFFNQGGLTLRDPNDLETFKVRRGKVNGYRDYFSPEQIFELDALVNSRLSPAFGYTAKTVI